MAPKHPNLNNETFKTLNFFYIKKRINLNTLKSPVLNNNSIMTLQQIRY